MGIITSATDFKHKYFFYSFTYFAFFTIYYVARISEVGFKFNPAIKYTLLSCLTTIAISIVMLSISISLSPVKLNLALFWLFNLIFLGLGQFSFLFDSNPYYLAKIAPTPYVNQASLIILIPMVFGSLTQIFQIKYPKNNEGVIAASPPFLVAKRAKVIFWLYFIFLLPFSQLIGGFSILFRSIRIVDIANQLSLPLYSVGFAFCYAVPIVNAVVFLSIHKYKLGKNQSIYTFSIVVWCVLISNPLGNARQTTLLMILPLVYFLLRKNSKFCFIFYALIAVILVYQSGPVNRFTGKLSIVEFIPLSQNGSFDAFPQISNGLYALSKGAFPLFNQILGSIFFYIPRSIWPNKPLDTGIVVAQFHGLAFQNLSAPWVLELFVNGRYPILIVGVVIVVRYLFRQESHAGPVSFQSVYIIIMFGLLLILMRGSLLQATGITFFSLAICKIHFPGIRKLRLTNIPIS